MGVGHWWVDRGWIRRRWIDQWMKDRQIEGGWMDEWVMVGRGEGSKGSGWRRGGRRRMASRQRSQSSLAGRGPQGAWSRGSQYLSESRGREKRLGGWGYSRISLNVL